jgi:3-oxoadipate enol-lactonase
MNPSEENLEATFDNCIINYNEANKDGKQTVIFIHGFPFDKTMWNAQIDFLRSKYHCIAYDLRGFGKSSAGKEEFSMDLFADDLDALMDLLQVKNAVICGLSMGGYIALRAVAKYAHRFRALILCDSQCIPDTPEGKEKRYKLMEQIEASGLEAYAEASVKNLFSEDSFANRKDKIEFIKQTILNTRPSSIIAALKALAARDETCSVLPYITVPTLVIVGREDKITPIAQAETLKQGIAGSTLHIIDSAAHLSPLEQPVQFNAVLDSFLEGLK